MLSLLLIVSHLFLSSVHAAPSARFHVILEKDGAGYTAPVGMILRCYGQGRNTLEEFFTWTGRCTGSCIIGPVDTLTGDPSSIRLCNVDATAGEERYTAGAYPASSVCSGTDAEQDCTMHIDLGLMRIMNKLPEEATTRWKAFFVTADRLLRALSYNIWCRVMGLFKRSC